MNKLAIITLLFALLYACVDPYENNITPAYEQYPIATYMQIDSSYTQWVALLKYTDLFNTMNLGANYTCFVPTDSAMNLFLQQKGIGSVKELDFDQAVYLVKYHTIPGAKYPQSLFDNGVMADTTATGDYLSIDIRAGGLNSIYINEEARIKILDIEATNGIIHVIDKVLTPVTETIWQTIDNSAYSIFKEAVELTGYADLLNTTTVSQANSETGSSLHLKKYFTLFAVPDEIYQNYSITSVNDLINLVEETGNNYTEPDNMLNKYIAYHILNQQLDFAALATFNNGTSKNIQTLATNELINISEGDEQLLINDVDSLGTYTTTIVKENVSTKNGVIHDVSTPMVIVSPPMTTVQWELTDYSDLASLFSTVYRKSTVTSTYGNYIVPGEVNCYKWAAIPSSNDEKSVAYLVANKNDAVAYEMVNYDCLYLDLGLYGWVEMQSPSIIKGTYTMKISYYSLAAATEVGKFLVIWDNNYIGSEISTHGKSTTKTQIAETTIGEVTFDETTTHTLRILAGDDRSIYLDYIEFIPVIPTVDETNTDNSL